MGLIILVILGVSIYLGYKFATKNNGPEKHINYKTEIAVSIPLQTQFHDYAIYDYIVNEPIYILKAIMEQVDLSNFFENKFKLAISEKIKNDIYVNPLNFKEEFNDEFDFISIDFETANKDRISACAMGLAFFKNNKIALNTMHYIKPPKGIIFSNYHMNLHNITKKDVEFADDFHYLWKENLSSYMTNNLIVLHNKSMDASIIKQLIKLYNIAHEPIKFIDTMLIAKNYGYPGSLSEICKEMEIEFEQNHNPKKDALVCGLVYREFLKQNIDTSEFVEIID